MGQEMPFESSGEHTCTECSETFQCRACHMPSNMINKFSQCLKCRNPFHNSGLSIEDLSNDNFNSDTEYFYFCKEECLLEFYHHMVIVQAFLNVIKEMNDENEKDNEDTLSIILPWARQ